MQTRFWVDTRQISDTLLWTVPRGTSRSGSQFVTMISLPLNERHGMLLLAINVDD